MFKLSPLLNKTNYFKNIVFKKRIYFKNKSFKTQYNNFSDDAKDGIKLFLIIGTCSGALTGFICNNHLILSNFYGKEIKIHMMYIGALFGTPWLILLPIIVPYIFVKEILRCLCSVSITDMENNETIDSNEQDFNIGNSLINDFKFDLNKKVSNTSK